MDHTQHENSDAIQEFLFWVDQKKELGTRGPSTSVEYPFISNANIDEFFGEAKIDRILRAMSPGTHAYANKRIIFKKYRKILCILLSIGKGKFIGNFIKHESLDDSKLPFETEPPAFPHSHDGLFKKFSEAQWMFHAAVFEPQRTNLCLCPENILPIIKVESIKDGEGHSAVVRKVILHNAHHSPPSWNMNRTNQQAGTFALKTYRPQNAAHNYEKEYKAFATLMCNKESTPGLIGFYGSFVQGDTYNLLLEFADQGTLEDYFQSVDSPYKLDDITNFWSGLFGVTQALVQIHGEVQRDHESSPIFRGWHQDIKPANILVVSGDRDSKYACQFKLGDLGQSHFREIEHPGTRLADKDSHGTRTYGAPECYRGNDFMHKVPLSVHTSVDIWSFGCVCSEAAVWVVRGKGALSDYRETRRQATSDIPGFEDTGCFHDGSKVLGCVLETLEDLTVSLRRDDASTREILGLIEDMLTREDSRLTAKQVWDKLDRCLKKKHSILTSARPLEHGPNPFIQSEFSPTSLSTPNNLASPRTFSLNDQQIRLQGLHSRPNSYAAASRNSTVMEEGTGVIQKKRHHQPQQGLNLHIFPEDSTIRLGGGLKESPADMSSEENLPNSFPVAPTEAPTVAHGETSRPINRPETIAQTIGLSYMSVMSAVHWRETQMRKSFLSKRKIPLGDKQNFMDHLQGRDQVFLVDDSAFMQCHQGDLAGLLGLLAFIVKGSDDDGIDVYFTGSNTEIHTKKYDAIIEGIETIKYSGNPSMAPALDKILERFLQNFSTIGSRGLFKGFGSRSRKPMTCYILTDGNWPDRRAVEQQLKVFVGRLKEIDIAEKGKFGIQFITFGCDEDAERFFCRLDSELDLDPDIVDAEPSNGNVWKMLFGSIKGYWDNDKGDNQTETSPSNHFSQSDHLRNVPHGSQDFPRPSTISHRQTFHDFHHQKV